MGAPAFGDWATAYKRYRPDYPPALFDRLCHHIGAPRRFAVEFGAGTGAATGALATRFERVVAFEPDDRMADLIEPHANLEIRTAAAEEAAFEARSLDAVVAATSFHWMDQALMAERIAGWLRRGGAFLAVAAGPIAVSEPARAFIAAEDAKWAAYKDDRLKRFTPYETVLLEIPGFALVEPFAMTCREPRSPEAIAGYYLTTSYANAYAADHGGVELYHAAITRHLAAYGANLFLEIPYYGALAIAR